MFCVPVDEFVSKEMQKVVVIVNFNSVTRWTVNCGYVEEPRPCFNLNNRSLYFVCWVNGDFLLLQCCTDDYCRATIRVVTVVYGVVEYFNHRSIGKLGFCFKQYINVGNLKELDYFGCMIKHPISVPFGNTKGFNDQC